MNGLPPKQRFPRALALDVARVMIAALKPACHELVIAGSLRRRKADVGDVEVLYIPRMVEVPDPEDFFGKKIRVNAVDVALAKLMGDDALVKRSKANGQTTWGEENKLSVHTASGVPVDFFAATHENWWNLLVCRTGGAATNMTICNAAIDIGWKWRPYMGGFSRPSHFKGAGFVDMKLCTSEREVFEFADIPYLEPWERP